MELEGIIKKNKEELKELQDKYRGLYQQTSFLDLLNEVYNKKTTQNSFYVYSVEWFENLFDDKECLKLDACPGELFFERDYIFLLEKNLLRIKAQYFYNYKDADRNIKLNAEIIPAALCHGNIYNKSYNVNEESGEEIERKVFTFFKNFNGRGIDYYVNNQVDFPETVFIKDLLTPVTIDEIVDRVLNKNINEIEVNNCLRKSLNKTQ